jgi:hypothetical protein
MHPRQRGVSMIGFLLLAVVVIFFAMLAMKLVPAYIEFFSVKKILVAMAQEGDTKSMSNADLRTSFAKRANVGYVTVVKPEDLSIDRSGGNVVISVDYEYRTALIGNISLVVDFSASSNPASAE